MDKDEYLGEGVDDRARHPSERPAQLWRPLQRLIGGRTAEYRHVHLHILHDDHVLGSHDLAMAYADFVQGCLARVTCFR